MAIRSTTQPGVFETRRSGGVVILLFIPVLCIGLATLAQFFGQIQIVRNAPRGTLLITGLWFTILAGFVILSREGAVIDLRRGTVATWWGLLIPMKRHEYPLAGMEFVSLIRHASFTKHGKRQTPRYRVYLAGTCSVMVDEFARAEDAREEGTQIADFLGLPIQDHTGIKSGA